MNSCPYTRRNHSHFKDELFENSAIRRLDHTDILVCPPKVASFTDDNEGPYDIIIVEVDHMASGYVKTCSELIYCKVSNKNHQEKGAYLMRRATGWKLHKTASQRI
jgi:hypothetical protein